MDSFATVKAGMPSDQQQMERGMKRKKATKHKTENTVGTGRLQL